MSLAITVISLALWKGVLRLVSAAEGQAREQESLWREESEGAARGRNVPGASRVLRLNRRMMARRLAEAPPESGRRAGARGVELPLPLPDGSFARFRIHESSIMEPGMAAQYPEIRTYSGQGIDDPTASMRCDLTPQGFHATILTGDRSATIQVAEGAADAEQYVSYFGADAQAAAAAVQCEAGEPTEPRLIEKLSARRRAPGSAAFVTGGVLRTYRIAIAAAWEYCEAFGGGTNAGTVASLVTWLNGVNAVYEREVAVRLLLVNNTNILYTTERGYNATNDPFTNGSTGTMLGEIRPILGNASLIALNSFDIGHVLGTGGAGVANLGVVCEDTTYLGGPFKSSGVSLMGGTVGNSTYVGLFAHELGHQFGAYHSFNATSGSICGPARTGSSAYESGSGMTLMSYAGNCSADNIATSSELRFHVASITQINDLIDVWATCFVPIATGNSEPTVDAGSDYTIPRNTPFQLTAIGSDPDAADASALTYVWEQIDAGESSYGNPPYTDSGDTSASTRPIFRPFSPVSSPSRVFPSLTYILNNANVPPATAGGVQTAENLPNISRTLNFAVTIRDNHSGGGGAADDSVELTVNGAAGPFLVTAPNTGVTWTGGTTQTVTWSVNNTNAAPINCANVKITLSTDGGATFGTVLQASTPNDGSETVTVPNGIFSSTARIKVEAVGNIFFDVSDAAFTLTPGGGAPAVSAISPSVGAAGDSVVITGINFQTGGTGPVSAVRFAGNVNASFTVNSNTQITATVPVSAATGPLTLSKPGFSDVQTPSYTVCFSSVSTLQADDGSLESASRFGSSGGTTWYVNRLTPASYPATLSYVSLRWDGFQLVTVGTSISVVAGSNTDGDASIDNTSFQSIGTTIPSLGGFVNFPVTPITINSGDFVIGFSTPYSSSNFPILTDTTAPHQSRSYLSTNGSSFSVVTDRDYFIRAGVYLGACSSGGCVATSVSSHPASQTVCPTAPTSFSVTAAGTGPFTYQWRKNTVNIPSATADSYSIASTVAGDAGSYDVVVTGSCGTATSNAATLTVNSATSVGAHPAGQTVCAGQPASFSVTAAGTGPFTYQWRKNTVNIPSATLSTYNIASTVVGDAGSYDVVVTGACGTATSNAATLTVNASTTSVSSHPQNQTVCATAPASFSVTAGGVGPFTYQWRKNTTNIPGATSSTYSIASTVAGDAGSYDVVVTGACGTATSNAATLTINPAATVGSHPANQTVCAGAPASFSVTAAGTGPFTYQWRKNTVNIPSATLSTYSIASTVAGDAGSYDVVVTGACGTATSNAATLTVNPLPVVSLPPAAQTVCAGGTATFTAAATGSPTPTVQWQVSTDGGNSFADLPGATSGTLTLTGVTLSQNGYRYRAVFTNGCAATSSAALLTVVSCSLSSASQSFPAAGGSGSTNVTAPSGAAWTAVSNAGWIVITSGQSGSGNGTVNFTVASSANPSRMGTITIAGQTFTADQASGCAVTVSPSNATLPGGRSGEPYSQTFTASGATSPTFTISAGALPNGLELAGNGALSGTPTVFGTFNFTVLATDTNGCTGSRAYTLLLDPPCAAITITPATLASGIAGEAYSQQLAQTGGSGAIAWSISAGSPPGGVTLDSETGLLSGTPDASGSYTFTVTATDATGCAGTRQYTLVISGAGLQFYPLATPIRLLDTRSGATGCDAPGAQIPGGTSRTQTVAGRTCSG
ncbi:MAG: M12 family metallo-peptidase, partial [Blastocatellia bacterium]|nr:M12 family metallo-peptidase [Blastocatellia bacterium]